MKTGPDVLEIAENESGRALDTAENKSGSAKHEKCDPTPSMIPPKMSLGAQNKKTGPDALSTDENEYGREKHDNGA
jgi:hypothetical protein